MQKHSNQCTKSYQNNYTQKALNLWTITLASDSDLKSESNIIQKICSCTKKPVKDIK